MTRIAPSFDPDDPRHGTDNGYANLKCRCDECRAAHREMERTPRRRATTQRYRRRKGIGPAKVGRRHGLRSTYTHGCRCEECRRAEATYRREYRQRNRGLSSGNPHADRAAVAA